MQKNQTKPADDQHIALPPRGIAVLAFVGPSFIWCAEYIGSGEVILATRTGAVLDGLLLTPLQALFVATCLYLVMTKMFNREAWNIIKPHWIFAVGLFIAFLVFGYFCVFQMPYIF